MYYTYGCTYCCIYVRTVPTAVVPIIRARTAPTPVQYVLGTTVRRYCTADVRTYIYYFFLKGTATK